MEEANFEENLEQDNTERYIQQKPLEEILNSFEKHLESLSNQELFSLQLFCKNIDKFSIVKLIEIISPHAKKYMVNPPPVVVRQEELDDQLLNDQGLEKDKTKKIKQEDPGLIMAEFTRQITQQKSDSKTLQPNQNKKVAIEKPVQQEHYRNGKKIDAVFVEKKLLKLIFTDILNISQINQLLEKPQDQHDFSQLFIMIQILNETFREYLNYTQSMLINQNLTLNSKACIDSLMSFSKVVHSNFKVMSAYNQIMNERLSQELESQLNELNSDNKLDDEFKQFYQTLANFKSDQNQQQITADGQAHQQNQEMVQSFKQLLKEYKQVQLGKDENLKDKLEELQTRLIEMHSQIPQKQEQIQVQNQDQTPEVPASSYEDFLKQKENEEKLKALQNDPKAKELIQKKKELGLLEVFKFYATQSLQLTNHPTFDQQSQEQSKLNLQFFLKLCNDFKIPGDKKLYTDIFKKKVYRESTTLDINTFKDSLNELFRLHNNQQIIDVENDIYSLSKNIQKFEQQQYQEFVDQYKTTTDDNDDYEEKSYRSKKTEKSEKKIQLDLEFSKKTLSELQNQLQEKQNIQDHLVLAHKFLQTDNKKYYTNTMKGFHQPFWIKEVKLPLEQQFLTNAFTGHTNNTIVAQQQQTLGGQSRNESTNAKTLRQSQTADQNSTSVNKNIIELNKSIVALQDQGGNRQQTLIKKKQNEILKREEIRDMMLKKIRDQREAAKNSKNTPQEAYYNLEQLRNVKNPKELLSEKDRDIDSIENIIGLDSQDLNDGYEFTFKPPEGQPQVVPNTLLQEYQKKILQQQQTLLPPQVQPQMNKRTQRPANLSQNYQPSQVQALQHNLTASQSKKSIANPAISMSPSRNQQIHNNSKVYQTAQDKNHARSSQITKSIDMKSKDYYTKMIQRANEIDSTEKNQEKMKKENSHNLHMKRLSVNRYSVNGNQSQASINKSVDFSQASQIKNHNNKSLIGVKQFNGGEHLAGRKYQGQNNLNAVNQSMIKL
eukprot:403340655